MMVQAMTNAIPGAVMRATACSRASVTRMAVAAPLAVPVARVATSDMRRAAASFAGRSGPLRASRTINRSRASFSCAAAVAESVAPLPIQPPPSDKVRVRFAPSPTGTLHVGGARTALFNWLYAKNQDGEFIIRVEDTDAERSTKESEDVVLRDLKWLGLNWDEGPDVGGEAGPYRQSERKEMYLSLAMKLVDEGFAYPCFCTDAELEKMREESEKKKLPPIYRGKWASASKEEVEEEMAKGTPYCYRFRVPKDDRIEIDDIVRGKVGWDTNTLGDFVLLRSNGLPVYNFCVAVDDALMNVTHVMRAEEHLPNTLRQALVYRALGFRMPKFGHMSLILAPDKSKLSKRHGATSVGEFKEEGYLPEAMVNYLSLLGWNDGTEQEIFSRDELVEKFQLERITKSGAVFDKTKLSWMNGQHLRSLPDDEVAALVGPALVEAGLAKSPEGALVDGTVALCKGSLELVGDAAEELRSCLGFNFEETVASDKAKKVVDDGFEDIVDALLAAADSGALAEACKDGGAGVKGLINGVGKDLGRKGKQLFMPMRIALTGRMQGPDVGGQLGLIDSAAGELADAGALVDLAARVEALRAWRAAR